MVLLAAPDAVLAETDAMRDAGLDYTESTHMLKNPHMGYPGLAAITLTENGPAPRNDSGFMWYYVNLNRFSSGNSLYKTKHTARTKPRRPAAWTSRFPKPRWRP